MLKIIDNIILLGTSHVAHQSQKEIIEVIEKYNPEVVGIELDLNRLKSLMKKGKNSKPSLLQMIKEFGTSGAIFALIAGYTQKKIGEKLNIIPGIDMKTAYLEARKKSIPTALIDQNIKITLRNLSKLSFLKKVKMFVKLFFKGMKKEYRTKLNFDIKKGVPNEKVIAELMKIVEKEIPELYKILIDDRNKHMVQKLLKLRNNHQGYILAVIGAGHLEGMAKELKSKIQTKQNTLSHKFTINVE